MREEVIKMENKNDESQSDARSTRQQKVNKGYNRMIVVLGGGVMALALIKYVIQPLLS